MIFRESKYLRKFLLGLPIFILLAVPDTFGQTRSKEVGGGILGSFYTGDLTRNLELSEIRPGITLQYRNNYNELFTLRYNAAISMVSGNDENPIDAFARNRDQSFDIVVWEAAAMAEFNFLNYRENVNQFNWSPYLFVGAGVFGITGAEDNPNESYSKFQPVIPFGGGFKYLMNWKWTLGIEFGARKTFFDYLDNVGEGDLTQKNYQYGNQYVNDWYYFMGVTVSYTFHIVPCPFEDYN